ncbi:MAG: helix-turn-helix domain-containing protein, partial [Lachnospiraceae bacterium]|nr:helix-turn-helix domain-containing protein [Lachnospiraceae bacterium]
AYFVILSGYNDFSYAQQAIRYSCLEYLLKPINKEQLIEILNRVSLTGRRNLNRDDNSARDSKAVLCKPQLDKLIFAISQNDITEISNSTDELYDEMYNVGMNGEIINMNMSYLQFSLIHLAVELDEAVDQEEILQYINDNVYDAGATKGTRTHLKRFAFSYADYLMQLRKNASRGVLQEIEREIKNNYAENLTLKDLGKKYYVNPTYLGQIFRKKYDMSFKDYLCNVRINEAAALLLDSDEKIAVIADKVGYKDVDYFIQKFIDLKGITPARYRRNKGIDN